MPSSWGDQSRQTVGVAGIDMVFLGVVDEAACVLAPAASVTADGMTGWTNRDLGLGGHG